jgi:uncharacterized protein YaaN involved in tellurite resistance
VRDHIERITLDLERHKTRLLTDVTALDRLYDANLAYFRELEHYIAAGDAKLAELDRRPSRPWRRRWSSSRTWCRRRTCATCAAPATTWSGACTTCA